MKIAALYITLFGLLVGCSSESNLTVATSANMQFAMEEIVVEFEKQKGVEVDLIVSSSGKLCTQIEQGAPYDVFVAANLGYPQKLYEQELTVDVPKIYAYGKLVMWTLGDQQPSYEMLLDDKIEKIAIANPKTAPYGAATVEVLKKQLLFEKIEHKLVYAESISQCNQFIRSKNVDIGFTSMAVVKSNKMKSEGLWTEVSEDDHERILQGVVVLDKSEKKKEANEFYEFIFSDISVNILNKYGYLTPTNE